MMETEEQDDCLKNGFWQRCLAKRLGISEVNTITIAIYNPIITTLHEWACFMTAWITKSLFLFYWCYQTLFELWIIIDELWMKRQFDINWELWINVEIPTHPSKPIIQISKFISIRPSKYVWKWHDEAVWCRGVWVLCH